MTKGYYTVLDDRAQVRISGAEARNFLQGLITQDVTRLDTRPMLYSAMLNAQGKLENDFFITKEEDSLILECELARAEALARKLSMFKLRRKITVDWMPVKVLALWQMESLVDGLSLKPDPRPLPAACRNIIAQDFDLSGLNGFTASDTDFYHELCIAHGVPSCSLDIAWGEDTVADINLDRLQGVSHVKGCYLGQELTSRMYHRGLAKRSLRRVELSGSALAPFSDIMADGHLIGEMRSSRKGRGLAVLRHDRIADAGKAGLKVLPVD